MNEKARRIIEVSTSLFVAKGFHATSIQEIAEKSGISKGAFYLHFQSKDDLLFAVFNYYFETMKEKIASVAVEKLSPRESFARQIAVYLEEFFKQKDFYLMQNREYFGVNKQLESLVFQVRKEGLIWLENNLAKIYGDEFADYLIDGTVIADGLLTGYVKVILFENLDFDTKKLSEFIVGRLDDMMQSLILKKESPLITKEMISKKISKELTVQVHHKVKVQIAQAFKIVEHSKEISEQELSDIKTSLNIMLEEIEKEEPKKVVFQGMLATIKGYSELYDLRNSIAKDLDIELL